MRKSCPRIYPRKLCGERELRDLRNTLEAHWPQSTQETEMNDWGHKQFNYLFTALTNYWRNLALHGTSQESGTKSILTLLLILLIRVNWSLQSLLFISLPTCPLVLLQRASRCVPGHSSKSARWLLSADCQDDTVNTEWKGKKLSIVLHKNKPVLNLMQT